MGSNAELRRVLDMIERGTISAAEGARLLETARPSSTASQTRSCPYCAETIPAHVDPCPECGSNLMTPTSPAATGSGFHALTGFAKTMIIYTLVVSGFALVTSVTPGINLPHGVWRMPQLLEVLLSGLGLAAGILMLQGRSNGWSLAIVWAALQIITIVVNGHIVNEQVFHVGINFSTNGQGLGVNLVGIILLILFIKAKPAGN